MTPGRLELIALPGIPLVEPGDDLAALILAALERGGLRLAPDDVLIVAQKIVSKAENRYAELDTVTPSAAAAGLARKTDKDPRLVELILSESRRVLRHRPGLVIVEHRLGFVMANAGIDASNIPDDAAGERVLLLPENPDASCRRLRDALRSATGIGPAIVINDSTGRAWRNGTVGIALGVVGLEPLVDLRGRPDLFGRPLRVSLVGLGDQLAAAASLVQGEADEGTPVALVRGFDANAGNGGVASLIRSPEDDLFR